MSTAAAAARLDSIEIVEDLTAESRCDQGFLRVARLRLRNHYAETLCQWRKNFIRNWHKARQIYDERFCRMWEFYLAASETAFRFEGMMNFQVQMTKQQMTLPMTRDYMHFRESGLRTLDGAQRPRPKLHSR